MVMPLMLFNSIINLNITQTQTQKLNSLDNQARRIITNSKIPSTTDLVKRNACNIVHKSIYGHTCSNFRKYFELINHRQNTRNNKLMLRLPKIKLEVGTSSFFYIGAKLFNELPLHVRKLDSHQKFKEEIKGFSF